MTTATTYEPTYWNQRGNFQSPYEYLRNKLVPDEGNAATEAGEMLRVAGNVYYDIYNNGGCNLDTSKKDDLSTFVDFLKSTNFKQWRTLSARLYEVAEYRHSDDAREIWGEARFQQRLDAAIDHLVVHATALDAATTTEKQVVAPSPRDESATLTFNPSPRPWKYYTRDGEVYINPLDGGEVVCTLGLDNVEDAQEIVKCVNAYPRLVELLRTINAASALTLAHRDAIKALLTKLEQGEVTK